MADFRKLEVWQKAHALSLSVHRLARQIRGVEYISLRSQMVRAAGSIGANIVEGRNQKSDRQFSRFLQISINSANELEYHLITARDFGVITQGEYLTLLNKLQQVRKMLYGLINYIDGKKHGPTGDSPHGPSPEAD